MNPEIPTYSIRLSRYPVACNPRIMPFTVALRRDGHVATSWLLGDSGDELAAAYGLTRNDDGSVTGRISSREPSLTELRRFWMDLFDHAYGPLQCSEEP